MYGKFQPDCNMHDVKEYSVPQWLLLGFVPIQLQDAICMSDSTSTRAVGGQILVFVMFRPDPTWPDPSMWMAILQVLFNPNLYILHYIPTSTCKEVMRWFSPYSSDSTSRCTIHRYTQYTIYMYIQVCSLLFQSEFKVYTLCSEPIRLSS